MSLTLTFTIALGVLLLILAVADDHSNDHHPGSS